MSKERIAITGATGLVGSRIAETWPNQEDLTCIGSEVDLTSKKELQNWLEAVQPTVLINCVAGTNVGAAEIDPTAQSQARALNTTLVSWLTELLPDAHLIHFGTDMVFDGRNGPYKENQPPESDNSKLTFYGQSKRDGEALLDLSRSTLIRIIYPVRKSFAKKSDYLRFPISLLKQGKLYPLFNDQYINFAPIDLLTTALQKIIDNRHCGVFHLATANLFTPYELITYAANKLSLDSSQISTRSIHDFLSSQPNQYRYPIRGGLSTTQTEEILEIVMPSWQEVVESLV